VCLFFGWGEDNVKGSRLVGRITHLVPVQINNERFLDKSIGRVMRISPEVQLRDQRLIARMLNQVVDVAWPPHPGPQLIVSRMHGFIFVISSLVSDQPGPVFKYPFCRRTVWITVVVPTFRVGLSDIDGGMGERLSRVEPPHATINQEGLSRF